MIPMIGLKRSGYMLVFPSPLTGAPAVSEDANPRKFLKRLKSAYNI
jgi:hypothetical protein